MRAKGDMKKLGCALVLVAATLALAGTAAANLSVGVNDDASKDAAVAPWFYSTMQSVGLKINTLTLLWDEGTPFDIAGAAAIDQAIARAKTSGVTIELDLYPMHSMASAQKPGRTNGIMDGFDFHPYPVPQTQPFAQGYSDVKQASVTNLSRIYQAFYDGFNGSPQKTIGQQVGGGTPVSLNETGIQ